MAARIGVRRPAPRGGVHRAGLRPDDGDVDAQRVVSHQDRVSRAATRVQRTGRTSLSSAPGGAEAAQTALLFKVGFWAALIAFAGAAGYMLSAFLQELKVVNDLHNAIIAFGASLLMPLPVLLAMLVLHYTVAEHLRFWTHAAVGCAIIYTTYNTLNYVVQLATVIPKGYTWSFDNQQGTQGPLTLLNQTPHSLFWDIDALGYIFLSLATLASAPVFANHGQERWVRRFFIANAAAIPFFCITYFWPGYSAATLFFGLPWGITVPGSLLALALYFRRQVARTVR